MTRLHEGSVEQDCEGLMKGPPAVRTGPESEKIVPVALRWNRLRGAFGRDGAWIGILAASFALMLAASWQRWADPIVDVGREMNQPLRLAGGEMLYSDVRHIYGPLSPWLHAALFRLLGPSLGILYADGILTAAIALGLVYWLGRQIMEPPAAGAAALNVMALCVFKPAGNYILPYSYNSLHGAALGLATLVMLTATLARSRAPGGPAVSNGLRMRTGVRASTFVWAGAVAGLATLAKTEMGAAAIAAGVTAAILVAHPDVRRGSRLAAMFIASAAAVAIAIYALVASRVGWTTLGSDSWLVLYNMPPDIAYFNGQVSGLAHPVRSLGRMLIATVKLGLLATTIAAISGLIVAARQARRGEAKASENAQRSIAVSRPWHLLAAVLAVLIVMSATTGLDRDKGPFLAMPFLLAGLLLRLTPALRRDTSARAATLTTFAVYALTNLARMILHVRSGGAYASFLLPISVVMFTFLWVGPFPGRFPEARLARMVRAVTLTLILIAAVVNGGVLAYRYRTRTTVPIAAARGTMIAEPDMGQAFNEALAYIASHTRPGDAIAVLPEGTSLTFLSGRRNPLREEIVTPGYLDDAAESRAIRQLEEARTALILVPNRPTAEFGRAVFGRDYCERLMRWIEQRYYVCAMFGPVKDPALRIGDPPFFIRAYCPAATGEGTPAATRLLSRVRWTPTAGGRLLPVAGADDARK